ncbi:S1/P1 nuclease [Saprospiraceae bacterium]|nr:S1/P1 nuclease [Saprospiraceae bacterium]
MKILSLIFCLIIVSSFTTSVAWGPTGHRATGEIAEDYLKRKTKKKVDKILGGKSLAFVSTFGDEIKADRTFKKYSSWHYVNIDDGKKYGDETPSEYGDLVVGIETCISVLKDKTSSIEDQEFHLKMLVHFVGDLHQPLHVGLKEDKGGNDFQVRWFDKGTNLHRVWDSDMINHFNMSYEELADNADQLSKAEIAQIESGSVLDWVHESQAMAKKVYASAESGDNLKYRYMYYYFNTLRSQLQKGGIRLAKILNDIYC